MTERQYFAGNMRVVVSEKDSYDPKLWSFITMMLICSPKPIVGNEIWVEIEKLQLAITNHLLPFFEKASGDASEEAVQARAVDAAQGVVYLAGNTKWAMQFGHETIKFMIQDVIARNLRSACSLLRDKK